MPPLAEEPLAAARRALGLEAPFFAPEQASAALRRLLAHGAPDASRSALQARLQALLPDLKACPHFAPAALRALESAPRYRQRLLDLAQETLLSEPLAPELCLFPQARTPERPGRFLHAVVFAAAPFFTHELYPLVADALVRDSQQRGRPLFDVAGVHVDWFDEQGRATRLLLLEGERFCECDLEEPLAPDSAHFLCLGRDERSLHALWSARLACAQVNPYRVARLADDKAATWQGWKNMGVSVPASLRVDEGEIGPALDFLRAHAEIAAKPNAGTEGEKVCYLHSGQEQDLRRHLRSCWSEGPCLLQERRDRLFYRDPQSGALHSLCLRLNAVSDGRAPSAESAYAQIGADPQTPASRGRGGRLVSLEQALANLATRDGRRTPPADGRKLRSQAAQAASLFAELLLVGLDAVLDLDPCGQPQPVFIEANSRPAGLSRSRLFAGGLPGVGAGLWDGVQALLACDPALSAT